MTRKPRAADGAGPSAARVGADGAAQAISSPSNARWRAWRSLVDSPHARRRSPRTLIEGEHLALAALAAGGAIQAVLVRDRSMRHAAARSIVERATAAGAACFILAPSLYDALSPVDRGIGVMLELEVPRPLPLDPRATGDLLVLDGVQEPGNAGALLRVAAAAGVDRVVSAPGTTALWAPKVMRAAMGAHFALHIVEHVPIATAWDALPGMRWLAADAVRGVSLWDVHFDAAPLAWVVGSEGSGLSDESVARIDRGEMLPVRIPIDPQVESLNVATAAAVCLFERCRQRSAG